MKSLCALLLFLLMGISFGCSHYSNIKGTVVDSATGKPIEGAVVVAQWTKPRGMPGMQYHELHKITETLTDREGKFSISGTNGVLIDAPEMIIYKEGYIPWRNDGIFPYRDKHKHEWENNTTYKLDVFTDKYTADQLCHFINSGIIGYSRVPIYHKIYNEISNKAIDEIEAKKAKNQRP